MLNSGMQASVLYSDNTSGNHQQLATYGDLCLKRKQQPRNLKWKQNIRNLFHYQQ